MKQPQLHESKLIKNFLKAVFAVLVIILSLCLNDQYVLAADEDIVYIPDEKFKNLLNKKLNVEDITADITEGQLATIKELRISSEVVDITGIEKCINLTPLYNFIHDNQMTKALISEPSQEYLILL